MSCAMLPFFLLLLLCGLLVEAKNSTKVGGRYIIDSKIMNKTDERSVDTNEDGTVVQKNSNVVAHIQTTTIVPDDENYVASKIVYEMYKVYSQINGLIDRSVDNFGLLKQICKLLKKRSQGNKNLSESFVAVLQKHGKRACCISKPDITDNDMRNFIVLLLHDISTGPHISRSRTLTVTQVEREITEAISGIGCNEESQDKNYFGLIVGKTVSTLLQNENNVTIKDSITEKVHKAVSMYNLKQKKCLKEKVFNIIIRTLSLLDYRMKFPNKYIYKSDDSAAPESEINVIHFNKTTDANHVDTGVMTIVKDPSVVSEEDDGIKLDSGTSINNPHNLPTYPKHGAVIVIKKRKKHHNQHKNHQHETELYTEKAEDNNNQNSNPQHETALDVEKAEDNYNENSNPQHETVSVIVKKRKHGKHGKSRDPHGTAERFLKVKRNGKTASGRLHDQTELLDVPSEIPVNNDEMTENNMENLPCCRYTNCKKC